VIGQGCGAPAVAVPQSDQTAGPGRRDKIPPTCGKTREAENWYLEAILGEQHAPGSIDAAAFPANPLASPAVRGAAPPQGAPGYVISEVGRVVPYREKPGAVTDEHGAPAIDFVLNNGPTLTLDRKSVSRGGRDIGLGLPLNDRDTTLSLRYDTDVRGGELNLRVPW
jgi:hypothetical protein